MKEDDFKKHVEEKVTKVEYEVWSKELNEFWEESKMIGIGVLLAVPLVCVAAFLVALTITTLGVSIPLIATELIVLTAGICWLEDKVLDKFVHKDIDKAKERCKDGMAIAVIKELSRSLEEEYVKLRKLLSSYKNNEITNGDEEKKKIEENIRYLGGFILKKYETMNKKIGDGFSSIKSLLEQDSKGVEDNVKNVLKKMKEFLRVAEEKAEGIDEKNNDLNEFEFSSNEKDSTNSWSIDEENNKQRSNANELEKQGRNF